MKLHQTSILLIAFVGIASAERPNLIYILCDDLGYGDISALNPEGKIQTPHVDRLVAEGMTFCRCPFQLVGLHSHALQWMSSQ